MQNKDQFQLPIVTFLRLYSNVVKGQASSSLQSMQTVHHQAKDTGRSLQLMSVYTNKILTMLYKVELSGQI